MPPFQSRSTGAFNDALISSSGVIRVTPESMPSAVAICTVIAIDLSDRGNTPPPSEIREVS